MKSKKQKDGSTGNAACLARNFYTKNIILETSPNTVVYEPSTPILTSAGLYDTIKVVDVAKDQEVNCVAKFDGKTITDNSTLSEEAEEQVTVKVCNTTDTSVQGNVGKLTFGQGTRIVIIPMVISGYEKFTFGGGTHLFVLPIDVSLCEFSIQLESYLWKWDTTDSEIRLEGASRQCSKVLLCLERFPVVNLGYLEKCSLDMVLNNADSPSANRNRGVD
ncbi:t cell receptor delta hypothetical protein [Limosa lapponica baueri]|uniref:Uncharacterized protein n=1 Tax=Limosa lapponica baueri TaxID=1758121 RepID=A0A2I0TH97_LIMLA|nr:t cell receptor delta hypothetical protein [Limosa lapponica baueri]